MEYGVGQIIGHSAFEIATRMRWPIGKRQLVTCNSTGITYLRSGSRSVGFAGGIALCAALPRAGDHRHRAIGRNVRKAHKPIRQWRARRNLQSNLRPAEQSRVLHERQANRKRGCRHQSAAGRRSNRPTRIRLPRRRTAHISMCRLQSSRAGGGALPNVWFGSRKCVCVCVSAGGQVFSARQSPGISAIFGSGGYQWRM